MPTDHDTVALVALRDEPLSVDEVLDTVRHPACGGIALFVGVVRDHDHGDAVTALDYEAHPSALDTMRTRLRRRRRALAGRADRRRAPHRLAARRRPGRRRRRGRPAPRARPSTPPATSSTPSRRRPPSGSTRAWATARPSGWDFREHPVARRRERRTRRPRRPGRDAPRPGDAARGHLRAPPGSPGRAARRPAHPDLRRHRDRGRPVLRRAALRRHVPGPGHQHPRRGRRQAAPRRRRRPDLPDERHPRLHDRQRRGGPGHARSPSTTWPAPGWPTPRRSSPSTRSSRPTPTRSRCRRRVPPRWPARRASRPPPPCAPSAARSTRRSSSRASPTGSPSAGLLEPDDVLVTVDGDAGHVARRRARGRAAARPRRRDPRSSCAGTATSARSPSAPPSPTAAPSSAWACGSTTTSRSTSRCNTGNVGGPVRRADVQPRHLRRADPRRAHRRQGHRRHRDDGGRRHGRPDRRHPPEARRSPAGRGRLLPRPGRELRRASTGTSPTACAWSGSATFDEGLAAVEAIAVRRHLVPAHLRLTAHPPGPPAGRSAAGCRGRRQSSKVARSACTSPGAMSSPRATRSSLSWSRWRSRHRAAPSRVTATSRRTSARAGVVGDRRGARRRHPRAGPARHPAARRSARRRARSPRTWSGQAIRASRSSRPSASGSSSCSTALRAPVDGVVGGQPVGELGLVREQVGGRHEGEEPHRLVPPGPGDVPLGVEGGEGERVGHGAAGSRSPDHGARWARRCPGYIARPRSTRGPPRRRDEESSESLGVVRRTHGSG